MNKNKCMKKLEVTILTILAVFMMYSATWAATYYVDNDYPSASDSGPGTESQPWQHSPGMVGWTGSATLNAGDTVYFDNTDTWTGGGGNSLLEAVGGVTYDGSTWGSGTRATIRATGTFSRAIVSIRDDDSTEETTVTGFVVDGNLTSNSGMNINWPSSVNLTGAIKRIENCEIYDLRPTGSTARYSLKVGAIGGDTCRNVEILDVNIHDVDTQGIAIYTAVNCPTCLIENVLIRGCTVGPNITGYQAWAGTGLLFKDNMNNITAEYNEIYDSALNNIIIFGDSGGSPRGLTIRYNLIHDAPGKYGITVQTPNDSDFEIYGNIIYGNGKSGLEFAGTIGGVCTAKIYNNTFYQNAWGELTVSDSSPRVEIKNNILYSNSSYPPLRANGGTITAHSNNLFYRPGGGTLVNYGGTTYTAATLGNWEATALSSDPLFEDTSSLPTGFAGTHGVDIKPNTDGLHIGIDSPVRDYGASLGASYNGSINSVGRPHGAGWDIGSYEYAGGGAPAAPKNLRRVLHEE